MYNVCPLSCISCMLKFVYVLMGHMAYCMNKLLTIYMKCVKAFFLDKKRKKKEKKRKKKEQQAKIFYRLYSPTQMPKH